MDWIMKTALAIATLLACVGAWTLWLAARVGWQSRNAKKGRKS